MTPEERLAQQLDEKDRQLEELEAKNEELEKQLDRSKWEWMKHVDLKADPSPGLPVPRLELRQEAMDGYEHDARMSYRLVYRHFLGHLVAVPLGETLCRGAHAKDRTRGLIPFRDGAHIRNEAQQLKLPAFVVAIDGSFETLEEACRRENIPLLLRPHDWGEKGSPP